MICNSSEPYIKSSSPNDEFFFRPEKIINHLIKSAEIK